MPADATQADIIGVGTTFEGPDGTTYTVREPDQGEQAEFQRWLEDRARHSVTRMTDLPPEEKAEQLDRLTDRVAAGVYEYNGEVAARALLTFGGISRLFEILFRVTPETAKELAKHRLELIAGVLRAKVRDDPLALGAALTRLGLPPDYLSEKPSSDSPTPPGTTAPGNSPG